MDSMAHREYCGYHWVLYHTNLEIAIFSQRKTAESRNVIVRQDKLRLVSTSGARPGISLNRQLWLHQCVIARREERASATKCGCLGVSSHNLLCWAKSRWQGHFPQVPSLAIRVYACMCTVMDAMRRDGLFRTIYTK